MDEQLEVCALKVVRSLLWPVRQSCLGTIFRRTVFEFTEPVTKMESEPLGSYRPF